MQPCYLQIGDFYARNIAHNTQGSRRQWRIEVPVIIAAKISYKIDGRQFEPGIRAIALFVFDQNLSVAVPILKENGVDDLGLGKFNVNRVGVWKGRARCDPLVPKDLVDIARLGQCSAGYGGSEYPKRIIGLISNNFQVRRVLVIMRGERNFRCCKWNKTVAASSGIGNTLRDRCIGEVYRRKAVKAYRNNSKTIGFIIVQPAHRVRRSDETNGVGEQLIGYGIKGRAYGLP